MMGDVERRARRLAAEKMNLQKDTYGTRLPDDLWSQCIPQAQHEMRIAVLVKLRASIERMRTGVVLQDWELRQLVGEIDATREHESREDKRIRVRNTGSWSFTDDEIELLDNPEQYREQRDRHLRQEACPGHERESTETIEQGRRGWHPAHCKHCGKDMSYDSGD